MTKRLMPSVIVLVTGTFLSVLNQTLLNPALPAIMAELSISATTAQWLISGFTLVNALVIAITAFLMDKFPTRKLFFSIYGIFAAGCLLTGLGTNFALVLAGRVLQGICAGVLIPMSITIMLLIFPREKRGATMGMFTFITMFAPAIGPVVSGTLTDNIGWRWMYIIMAALAAALLAVAALVLKNVGDTKPVALDKFSVALSSVGLVALLYGFSEVGNMPLQGSIAIAAGAALLALFGARQLKLERPFLQIRVLAEAQFRNGTVLSMLICAALTAVSVTLPLYIQNVRGMTATITGIVMMPGAVLGAIAGYFAGTLRDRFGSRYLAIIGVAMLAAGSLGMSFFNMGTSVPYMIAVYAFRMAGNMLAYTPINIWSIDKLPDSLLSHGNAVAGTLRQVAATLGTAIMVSVMALFTALTGSDLAGISAAYWLSFALAAVCVALAFIQVRDKKETHAERAGHELDKAMKTPPYTVKATDTLAAVIDKLIEYKTSGVSVVDDENHLVGFISDGDLLRYLRKQDISFVADNIAGFIPDTEEFADKVKELLAKNIMTVAQKHPVSVERTASLPEVCSLFMERKLNKLPVTQDDVLVGTISRGDIMRFLMSQMKG
jgi:EmrB/QacA subfamily drug resistance transporter